MSRHISPDEFRTRIFQICDAATSLDPQNWTHENPFYAHCAVVALLAQDIFGGVLLRASLEPYPKFAHLRSHYWNKLSDGSELDFTESQFCGHRPALIGEIKTREYVLYDPKTGLPREIMSRYKLLVSRLSPKWSAPR